MAGKLAMLTGALVLALALALAGSAQADTTFCVDAPGCVGTDVADLPAAIAQADAAAGDDRIVLGPGAHPGPFVADADNVVELVGAGRDATVITLADDNATALTLQAPFSAVRGLTVRLGGGTSKTGIEAERAQDVAIEGTAVPSTGFKGSAFAAGTIDLGAADGTIGFLAGAFGLPPLVEDAAIRAGTGVAGGAPPPGPPTVRRTRIVAGQRGIDAPAGVTADDVAIELTGAGATVGVQIGPSLTGTPANGMLRHVTLAGAGGGQGLVVTAMAIAPIATSASATLHDSVIAGFAQHIAANGGDCVPMPCAPALAKVTTAHSAYDPARTLLIGPGELAHGDPIVADPRLRGDLTPRHDSPLVDAADPAAVTGDEDASGLPRTVDGDGDGTARADVGAIEYQRRAPRFDPPSALPGEARVGEPIRFSVDPGDPDGEAVTVAWEFSDGTTANGAEVTRAFTAPGSVVANVRVTDEAGASSGASVTVAIKAPPSSPPSGGDPGPGSKGPPVVARVLPERVRLRAVKRRDRRAPYRFALRGRLVLPEGVSAAGCQDGRVRLSIRAGKRALARRATLEDDCTFAITVALGRKRARRVVVTPRFAGTAALAPRDGRALKLRAG